jgi:hypothetical protein
MPTAITITGTRGTRHRPAGEYYTIFTEYLSPFADQRAHFYVGGAIGIDALSLLWLSRETPSRVTVAVPGTISGQPDDAQQAIAIATSEGNGRTEVIELAHEAHPSTESYYFRNRWMVDRSEFVIAFPHNNDHGRGTWYTADYAAGQGKPRLIIPI